MCISSKDLNTSNWFDNEIPVVPLAPSQSIHGCTILCSRYPSQLHIVFNSFPNTLGWGHLSTCRSRSPVDHPTTKWRILISVLADISDYTLPVVAKNETAPTFSVVSSSSCKCDTANPKSRFRFLEYYRSTLFLSMYHPTGQLVLHTR